MSQEDQELKEALEWVDGKGPLVTDSDIREFSNKLAAAYRQAEKTLKEITSSHLDSEMALARVEKERDQAQAACAAMREALQSAKCSCFKSQQDPNNYSTCGRCRALASEAGKELLDRLEKNWAERSETKGIIQGYAWTIREREAALKSCVCGGKGEKK